MFSLTNASDPKAAAFTFRLLGQVALLQDGQPLNQFRSQKEAALLIYLAHTGQSHPRTFLAELLWSDRPPTQARSNLRTALTRLRKQAGDALIVTRHTLALAPEALQQVDSSQLLDALAGIGPIDSAATANTLEQALQGYTGVFLPDFYVTDAPRFDEWAATTREHIHRQVIAGYNKLANYALATGDAKYGLTIAQRWLQVDELDEGAHTFLIQMLLKDGRVREAVTHYDACVALLRAELGVAPPAAMTALIQGARRQVALRRSPRRNNQHNLPMPHDRFVGRVQVLKEIRARLDQPWCRLVTVVGQGGAGKTRLALTVAQERLHRYADGVWLAELANIDPNDPDVAEAIAVEIATALDLRLSGSARPVEQLLTYLQDKQMLLLLDNFDLLIDGGIRLILEIIQKCEEVQLLVTSREAMDLRAEWIIALGGLPHPRSDADESPSEAVELFLSRWAQQQWQDVHADDLLAVRQICRLVEGLPLAIELAASLTNSVSVREIADGLGRGYTSLTTPLRDTNERHRSLQAVFEMSWDALSPALQLRLARLSVFHGDFTRDAAWSVGQANPQQLATLQEKSLLLYDRGTDRYRLHPVVRRIAATKLSPDDPAQRQHAIYFLRWLAQHAPSLENGQPQRSAAAIQSDIDNVRVAWQTGLAWREAKLLLAALKPLSIYYQLSGLTREGEAVMYMMHSAAAGWGSEGILLATRAGLEQARFQNRLGQHRPAIQTLRKVLRLARECGDRWAEGMAHVWWGEALWRLGEYDASRTKLSYALQVAQTLDDTRLTGWCHHQLGIIDDIQGRYKTAERHLEVACSTWRSLKNVHTLSNSLNSFGLVHYHQGNLQAAQEALEQALMLCSDLDNRHLQALLLNNLSAIAIELKDPATAHGYLQRALTLAIENGNLTAQGEILVNLGRCHHAQGEVYLAIQCLEEGLQIARSVGNRYLTAAVLMHLARAVREQQEWERAEDLYLQTIAIAQQNNMQSILCETLLALTDLLKDRDVARARTYGFQAYNLARTLNLPSLLSLVDDLNRTLHFAPEEE